MSKQSRNFKEDLAGKIHRKKRRVSLRRYRVANRRHETMSRRAAKLRRDILSLSFAKLRVKELQRDPRYNADGIGLTEWGRGSFVLDEVLGERWMSMAHLSSKDIDKLRRYLVRKALSEQNSRRPAS